MKPVVVDVAGASVGGAARWVHELHAFLAVSRAPVTLIGHGRRLSPRWLLQRESSAAGAAMAIAANNASFAIAGKHRKVLLGNALHFALPHEEHLVARMPRSLHAQIPVIRQLCRRAGSLVVPSSAMAERVLHHLPSARNRIVVQHHPVTALERLPSVERFLLVPVLPAPYKNLDDQLALLRSVIADEKLNLTVRHTMTPVPYDELRPWWQKATGVFFPCTVESFGYPLAEARAAGIPVIAPRCGLAEEIAGPALLPYDPSSRDSLALALSRLGEAVAPDPQPFSRAGYFHRFLELP